MNEFDVGGGDIRSIGGVAEASGGAVAGVADNSDDWPVVEVRVGGGASCGQSRQCVIVALSG